MLPFAIGMIYVAVLVVGHEAGLFQAPGLKPQTTWRALGCLLLITGLFSFLSLGTWFWEIRILLDHNRDTLVVRRKGIVRVQHQDYAIRDIALLQVTFRRSLRGTRTWSLAVVANDGSVWPLVERLDGSRARVKVLAASISERIGVPLAIRDEAI
jgi:hypothetical protein